MFNPMWKLAFGTQIVELDNTVTVSKSFLYVQECKQELLSTAIKEDVKKL